MIILAEYTVIGSAASPLINLALRVERRLLIRKDSPAATFVRAQFGMIPAVNHIEDLNDESVRHLTLNGNRVGQRYRSFSTRNPRFNLDYLR